MWLLKYHAGAVVRPIQVPAVSVGLACAAPLRALIYVSAAHPGHMLGVASVTGTGEAPNSVGTGGVICTIFGPIEVDVVHLTLIELIAGWLVHVSLAVVTISAVSIDSAPRHPISTPVVVFVADSVAAVVRASESKPG